MKRGTLAKKQALNPSGEISIALTALTCGKTESQTEPIPHCTRVGYFDNLLKTCCELVSDVSGCDFVWQRVSRCRRFVIQNQPTAGSMPCLGEREMSLPPR